MELCVPGVIELDSTPGVCYSTCELRYLIKLITRKKPSQIKRIVDIILQQFRLADEIAWDYRFPGIYAITSKTCKIYPRGAYIIHTHSDCIQTPKVRVKFASWGGVELVVINNVAYQVSYPQGVESKACMYIFTQLTNYLVKHIYPGGGDGERESKYMPNPGGDITADEILKFFRCLPECVVACLNEKIVFFAKVDDPGEFICVIRIVFLFWKIRFF